MKNPRRAHLVLFAALLFGLAPALLGQPSGGPYGPVARFYELPEAKRIYYVSPDGVADAPGDRPDQPTTLETAIAKAVTGDAIALRGGVYRAGGLRLSQGIVMQPYRDERPILKGTRVATQWEALPDGTWRTRWSRLFPAQPADWWRRERHVERTPLHRFNNDMVFLDGQLLQSAGGPSEVDETSYFIDYERGEVIIGADPSGRQLEITAHNSALVRTMRSAHGKPNDGRGPTLRGITFTQYARLALEVEGIEPGAPMDPSQFGKEIVGTTLEDLEISHCSRVAGYFRGDGLTIRHCLITDTGTEGIYVINSADVLLERNVITRTNSAERFTGYYASAVKIFNQSYRVVCRDNLVIDNPYASGIWYDVGNVDGVIANNWVQNTNDGFFFEISQGALCVGNLFVNCSPGIRVLNSAGVQAYQNTLYNSPASFERSSRSSEAGDHFGWHASAGPAVEARHDHVFVNNLLVTDDRFDQAPLRFFQTEDLRQRMTDPQVQQLDGNVYVRLSPVGKEPPPLIVWSPTPQDPGFAGFSDLERFRQEHPGFENSSAAFPDYRGPLFRSIRLGHFELLPGYPGADAGAELPDAARELLRQPPGPEGHPGAFPPLRP